LYEGLLKDISPSLGLDDPDLIWHDGLDVPIDPFRLEDEFKDTGPLQKQSPPKAREPAPHDKSTMSNSVKANPEGTSRTERRARKRAMEKHDRRLGISRTGEDQRPPGDPPDSELSDSDGKPELNWDICSDLPRKEKRA
jgi:hypothetical protein